MKRLLRELSQCDVSSDDLVSPQVTTMYQVSAVFEGKESRHVRGSLTEVNRIDLCVDVKDEFHLE